MTGEGKYLAWQPVAIKGASFVHRFDTAPLKKPEAEVAASWPVDAYAVVDSERGFKTPMLTDCLRNNDQHLLVSARLKEFLDLMDVTDVEYLRLKVIDRTGRVLDPCYYLIHFLHAPDCLDLEASGATRSRAIPSKAETLERLVFKNDPLRALFRPSTYNKVTLVRWALAEAMADVGFSGLRFMGLFDFGIRGDLPPNPSRFAVDALCHRLWTNAQRRGP